ncbi:MAG: adenosine deaminase [Deltaproteobacteria bacterium]|nr:adenosine deaminase [Deltaproteobacteria bacterium]
MKPTPARFAATPDYADLHRHLGGAVHPKILYGYLHDHTADVGLTPQERDWIHGLLTRFPTYESLRGYFSSRRATLAEYLELHKLVEPLQTPGAMAYFLYRIARGARVFEHASLLELRFCPYLRTDPSADDKARITHMEAVIEAVAQAARQPEFAVDIRLLLCLHSLLPDAVNQATIDLALRRRDLVRGIDIAGPEERVAERMPHFVACLRRATEAHLSATAHVAESHPRYIHSELFPYLQRIGHGVQIPLHRPDLLANLSRRRICFELCPSTYLQTGTFTDLRPVREAIRRLDDADVPYCFATDNPAFNGRYLQAEYELALEYDLINFQGLARCQWNAFAYAF